MELDVTAIISPALLEAIKELGGVVEFAPKDPASHSLRILAPLANIAKLAARSDVLAIRKAMPVLLNAADDHGFAAHNVAIAQTTLGARGAGIKVGVMSDSADDSTGALKRAFASGDMPTSLKILDFQAGGGIGEGLAMMEIVHRIAPDASLVFATGNGNSEATAQNIRDLAAAGCKIIIDDVTHFDESPFQDSAISKAVKDLSSTGVMFFSAAGNNGNKRSGTSSTFEGDFVPSGQFLSGPNAPHDGAVAGFTSRGPNGGVSDRIVLNPRDAGNAVVVRAPRSIALSTLWVLRDVVAPLLDEVGAPPGVLNVVCSNPKQTLDRWVESPYFQYFCGEVVFQHVASFDRSSLTRWRQRLGEEQIAALLQESLSVAHRTKAIETKDLERVVVDTTVQEKAIAHPTDARLTHRAIEKLVALAKREGVELRQSYLRVAKRAAIMVGRYTEAYLFKRARRADKFRRTPRPSDTTSVCSCDGSGDYCGPCC